MMLCARGAIEVGIVGGDSDLNVSGESIFPLLFSLLSELLLPPDRYEEGDKIGSRLSVENLTACALPLESGAPLRIPVVVEIVEV